MRIMLTIFGVMSAFLCAIGALLMLFGGLSIFFEKAKRYTQGLSIACFVFVALYFLEGIVSLVVYNQTMDDLHVSTLSFIPLIFALPVFVGWILCRKYLPDGLVWRLVSSDEPSAALALPQTPSAPAPEEGEEGPVRAEEPVQKAETKEAADPEEASCAF